MRRVDAAENVARLLRATRDAVADQGPQVNVRAIADRAQVGVSTLYRHFGGKQQLIDSISVHRWTTLLKAARQPVALEQPLSRIVFLSDLLSRMVSADAAFIENAGLRVGRLPQAIRPPKAEFDAAFAAIWLQAQVRGQVHRWAQPDDLIELAGGIRDRARRPAQMHLLIRGVCVEPELAGLALEQHLRARDPHFL